MGKSEHPAPRTSPSIPTTVFGLMRSLIARLTLLLAVAGNASAAEISADSPGYRGPEDLLLSADESRLYTANRQSGSISVVDLAQKLTVEEFAVGGEPVQLAWLSQDRMLLVDQAGHRLILLAVAVPTTEQGQSLEVLDECQVAPYPIRVEIVADGSVAFVSSIWSKAITKVALAGDKLENPKIEYLTFSPREMLPLAEGAKLLVSDNFSGRVGVVDTATLKLEHAREFPAHNIRAMRLSHDSQKVIFAHQMLNSLAVTNHNDIHWGLLMSNDLRWLNVDNLLDATADFYRESFMQPIGQPNEGGGDPTDVALIPDGQVIVTLGGASEVGIGKEGSYGLHRTEVSGRPMAVTVPAAGNIAYVACATEDAIAVIDLKEVREIERIPLGPMRPLTQVEEGEKLFYDSRLSMESWMSCHSCHTDGHSIGIANDNLSDGSFGTPKKILSLLGKRHTAPFGWTGNSANYGRSGPSFYG
jgi:DNA-binding beta-propeller fold protein YncE